jgi:hypothetical protein
MGDGITWRTGSVIERELITNLLRKKGYKLFNNYHNYGNGINPFNNNFRFNKNNQWVTSSVQQVTNPMSYEQMMNLIEGNTSINYEIY